MTSVAKLIDRLITDNKNVQISLPDGSFVPFCFHITEVGKIKKDFIDCGGVRHQSDYITLQVWIGDDSEHRLQSEKLAKVISKGLSALQTECCGIADLLTLPIEIEYDQKSISNYPLVDIKLTPSGVVLIAGEKHTACLAPDKCGVSRCC